MLSVAVRTVASAQSSRLSVFQLGGFWRLSVPRMPCTLPPLPTLTTSGPSPVMLVVTPVARTLMVSAPEPVVMFTLWVS